MRTARTITLSVPSSSMCVYSLPVSLARALSCPHSSTLSLHPLSRESRRRACDKCGLIQPDARIHARSRTARSRSFATSTRSTHSNTSPITAIPMRYGSMIICVRAQRERTTGRSPCPEDPSAEAAREDARACKSTQYFSHPRRAL